LKPQHFAVLAGGLLLVALVLMIMGRPQADAGKAAVQPPQHVVTVTGEGEVRIRPDQAVLSFGIWTQGASAAEAEALNVASMQRVRDALVAAGMDEHSLEAVHKSVSAGTYQDFTGVTRISGFQAEGRITGTLRSTAKVQAVVDAALATGATSLESVVYGLDSQEQSREAAMQSALDNARTRATALARAEGGNLGDLISMEVLQEEPPGPVSSGGAMLFRARVKASFGY
jgi:uncharacterized protein